MCHCRGVHGELIVLPWVLNSINVFVIIIISGSTIYHSFAIAFGRLTSSGNLDGLTRSDLDKKRRAEKQVWTLEGEPRKQNTGNPRKNMGNLLLWPMVWTLKDTLKLKPYSKRPTKPFNHALNLKAAYLDCHLIVILGNTTSWREKRKKLPLISWRRIMMGFELCVAVQKW